MRDKLLDYLPFLLLGLCCVGGGVVMISNDLVAIGIRLQYSSYSALDGYLLIFMGIVFLITAYYSLSPFNKIRRFFEGSGPKKKKKKPSA